MSHARPREKRRSRVARNTRRGEVGRILFWGGISNLALVGFFVAGMNPDAVRPVIEHVKGHIASAVLVPDPLSTTRPHRTDNELFLSLSQPRRKGPLAMTRVSSSGSSVVNQTGDAASGDSTMDQPDDAGGIESTGSFDIALTTEEVQGLKTAPILLKDQNSSQLIIGNFKPMSLIGGTNECLEIGYSMLGDTNSANDLLEVLTASEQITVARICARNGSVVITCRNDQITVSPRRPRPGDSCGATG